MKAQVGQPQLKILEDAKDGRTRFVELQIPVTEGPRYRIGEVNFAGNTVVKTEGLRPLFKMDEGRLVQREEHSQGLREGARGLRQHRLLRVHRHPRLRVPERSEAEWAERRLPTVRSDRSRGPAASGLRSVGQGRRRPNRSSTSRCGSEEGKQYFVNRHHLPRQHDDARQRHSTRDPAARGQRVQHGGAEVQRQAPESARLLQAARRGRDRRPEDAERPRTGDNKVDVRLKFEEQNRNQITFGAGVSQYEGFFGQLAFQTSNFLGRGETFSVSAQQGNRAKNYQVGFTEPFLFDRPITAGIDVFNQEIEYIGQFTQASTGMNTVWGFPAGPFSRIFVSYSYQRVQVKDLNPFYSQAANLANNPFLADTLLTNQGGERRISKIGPSYLYNTVDNPIFPTTGKKLTLVGGTRRVSAATASSTRPRPKASGTRRTPGGRRSACAPRSSSSIRTARSPTPSRVRERPGPADLREAVPRRRVQHPRLRHPQRRPARPQHRHRHWRQQEPAVQRGIPDQRSPGPVRLVLFADAGQVRDEGRAASRGARTSCDEIDRQRTDAGRRADALYAVPGFINRSGLRRTRSIGTTPAFKSSMGAEIRFFMPVLNVPFRLIFAANPSRTGVLDNSCSPRRSSSSGSPWGQRSRF